MRVVRYSRVGCFLIDASPILSFVVFLLLLGCHFFLGEPDYLVSSILFTVWNISILTLVIVGVAMCCVGYRKRRFEDVPLEAVFLTNVLLVLWGVFVLFFASAMYGDFIDWSENPGVRALTSWDYLQYWTWELKAVSWIGSGLLLTITSLMKMLRLGVKGWQRRDTHALSRSSMFSA